LSLPQTRDAVAVIIKEGDAVLLKIHVMKEKEIVMDQETEVVMMGMLDAKEI